MAMATFTRTPKGVVIEDFHDLVLMPPLVLGKIYDAHGCDVQRGVVTFTAPNGEPVTYVISGWNPSGAALVLERPPALKEPDGLGNETGGTEG